MIIVFYGLDSPIDKDIRSTKITKLNIVIECHALQEVLFMVLLDLRDILYGTPLEDYRACRIGGP